MAGGDQSSRDGIFLAHIGSVSSTTVYIRVSLSRFLV